MDYMQLLQPLFNVLWYLVPLAILTVAVKSGEAIVSLPVKLCLDKSRYHLIKNVTLPMEDGTIHIDHIIVSRYGVFAVETKNMMGWIFGNAKRWCWMQKIFKYSQKFQNPLC